MRLFLALFLVLGTELRASDLGDSCERFLKRLRSSTLVYRPDCCGANVSRAVDLLRAWEPDFDPERARVLIIRPAPKTDLFPLPKPQSRWVYHVVLKYGDRVVDLDHPGPALPVREYFQSMFLDTKRPSAVERGIRRAWGARTPWDNAGLTVSEVAVDYYQKEFPPWGFQIPPAGIPVYGLKEYLQRAGLEPGSPVEDLGNGAQ